jgi:hypothetical protein
VMASVRWINNLWRTDDARIFSWHML